PAAFYPPYYGNYNTSSAPVTTPAPITTNVMTASTIVPRANGRARALIPTPAPDGAPAPAPPSNGTYPYDGGPQNPVPMPQSKPVQPAPAPGSYLTGLPARTPRYAYHAYGEKPAAPVPASNDSWRVAQR